MRSAIRSEVRSARRAGSRGIAAATVMLTFALSGCIPFEGRYAAAPSIGTPDQPLAGQWIGEWSAGGSTQTRPARAVIDPTGSHTADLWLELSGFRRVPADWIAATDVRAVTDGKGVEHFSVKLPMESLPKQGVWSVAIALEGECHGGQELLIHYRTNDAMRELGHGIIRLHRPK